MGNGDIKRGIIAIRGELIFIQRGEWDISFGIPIVERLPRKFWQMPKAAFKN
jgi:hypothetical protein